MEKQRENWAHLIDLRHSFLLVVIVDLIDGPFDFFSFVKIDLNRTSLSAGLLITTPSHFLSAIN